MRPKIDSSTYSQVQRHPWPPGTVVCIPRRTTHRTQLRPPHSSLLPLSSPCDILSNSSKPIKKKSFSFLYNLLNSLEPNARTRDKHGAKHGEQREKKRNKLYMVTWAVVCFFYQDLIKALFWNSFLKGKYRLKLSNQIILQNQIKINKNKFFCTQNLISLNFRLSPFPFPWRIHQINYNWF